MDRQTTSSAASAFAILGGVKVNYGTFGFDANVLRGNCTLVDDPAVRLDTMVQWSLRAGHVSWFTQSITRVFNVVLVGR